MSKVDAMQAMREARYAARLAPKPTAAATSRPAPAARKKAVEKFDEAPAVDATADVSAAPEVEATPEALCGHRSMNNRMCRRPAGHSEKNHRYN